MSLRIIVGAGGTQQEGWISLERKELDIRDRAQWHRLFLPGTIRAVLSEHVLEHLSADDARTAAGNIYEMLAPGGHWRVAVPDANNPDPIYQEFSRPGGPGQQRCAAMYYAPGEPDHKVHYNVASLSGLLQIVGFQSFPLEWYDEAGQFHSRAWSTDDGAIKRCAGSPYLWLNYLWANCWNTSLIVDGVKDAASF